MARQERNIREERNQRRAEIWQRVRDAHRTGDREHIAETRRRANDELMKLQLRDAGININVKKVVQS